MLSFLKACPKLDHMTHFGFHGNRVRCVFRMAQIFFLQKPLTKDALQIALILVFNEGANAKTDVHLSKADSQRKLCGLGIN